MSDVNLWSVQVVATFSVTFTSGPDPDNYVDIYNNDGTLVVHGTSENGSFTYDLDLGIYDVDCYKEGFVPAHVEDLVVNQDLTYDFGDLNPMPQTIAEFATCPGCGWWTGPFQVGMLQARIADFKVTNTGDQEGLVFVEIWEYPGETTYESLIFETNFSLAAGATGPSTAVPVNIDVPSIDFFEAKYPGMPPPWPWDLCARVRGMSEEFEPCVPGMSMTVGVMPGKQRLEINPWAGLLVVAGVVAIPILLLRK